MLKLTKQLEEVGFSRAQAESQIQVIAEIIEGDLATKQDLEKLRSDLENKMTLLNTHLENRMDALENRLTIKLGAMMMIGFTSMITLMKVWAVH